MELSSILEVMREFGPSAVIFIFGLWGILKSTFYAVKDKEKAQIRELEIIDKCFRTIDQRELLKKREHDEAIEYRKKVTYTCDNFAKEILLLTGADGVNIYEYCNGTSNLSGIPFLHFRTLSKKTSGFTRGIHYEKTDINVLGIFLLDLEKEQIITIKNMKKEKDKYPELSDFVGLSKHSKGVFANIVGLNSPSGFISVTFGHNKKVDYELVEKIVFEYVQKISSLLDYSNINS